MVGCTLVPATREAEVGELLKENEISSIFSDHNGIKLETITRGTLKTVQDTWKLNSRLLNDD